MTDGYKLKKPKLRKVTIPQKEYLELKKYKKIDRELLEDIAHGIRDILSGKITKD